MVDGTDGPSPSARIRTSVTIPVHLDTDTFSAEFVSFHGLVDSREHLALVFGNALEQGVPLVRLHSECLTGDVFGSARCDCGPQLRESTKLLSARVGLLLYLRQEGRGIGLYNKIDAYRLQDAGMDTFQANRALNFDDDHRDYRVAAQMLCAFGIREIDLLTNKPAKAAQLTACGITVRRRLPTGVHVTEANRRYLQAKVDRASHIIDITGTRAAQTGVPE
ncbi:MAG: GTP cyclohydrolase II [Kutzneria sp.]|nr:GTP cyclohydrolase II [Kutzneria sp.]MBV9843691.1 GTP cyclohydrolase II [Kutzneria sp.]